MSLLFSSGSLLDSIHLGQGPTKFLIVFIDLLVGLTNLLKNRLINCLPPLYFVIFLVIPPFLYLAIVSLNPHFSGQVIGG